MAESIVGFLIKQLSTLISQESTLLGGLRPDVQFIKDELGSMKAFLRQAEAKEDNDSQLQEWIKQVREVAYDAEDVLDDFAFHFARGHADGFVGHVEKIYNSTKNLKARHRISLEIKDIKARVVEISARHQRYQSLYGTQEIGSSFSHVANEDYGIRAQALLIEEAKLVGIDQPKKELISKILDGHSHLKVVSVMGMGGLGKTTPVKKVYDIAKLCGFCGGILSTAIANLSTKLTSLWLNDNIISGSLPSGIGNLASLGYLDVRNNSLSGIIPDSVGKLVKMQELYLSENSFTGEIPSTIGDISELQILVLEQNMLTGNIPVSLSNCSNLQGFTVTQNRLSGALPKELLGLSSLSLGLLLVQNHFTGSLPSEVGNMKNLVSLDISENKLSGEIPTSIDGCEMLEYLRLKGNFLEGSVPSTLGELKSIQVIDLSHNNLSGQIPASLAKLNFISTLNLSYNMLAVEVPVDGSLQTLVPFQHWGMESYAEESKH